ncbi:alpha/beta hydrolase fold domain-containing protein [Paenibacillus sp. sgz500958]|uniref:alpha/beta hydrolase fold domain-containing protein n=1 Tax=Paenibacillus sp. sgz500958 TaxID=3242475 RepID=UPI0036D3F235
MEKVSLISRAATLGFRILRINEMWKKTGKELRKVIDHKQATESYEPPAKLSQQFNISKWEIEGHSYYVISGKSQTTTSSKHILYLHGGGYVLKISSLHWDFIADMVEKVGCTVTVPMYPLAPKYGHADAFGMLVPLYQIVAAKTPYEDIVIMGDSAGGGMSLALAQLLKLKNIPQPGQIILISPVMDMTFSNPEIKAVEAKDPIVAVPAVREIAEWYAGEKGIQHHLISPINGDSDGLGNISIFIGTHDIVYPDVRKFRELLMKQGIELNYYEYSRMLHVWPLFFFPESHKAREEIWRIIQSGVS